MDLRYQRYPVLGIVITLLLLLTTHCCCAERNSSDIYPDSYWLLKQLHAGNYGALEEKLPSYQANFEAGRSSDRLVQWAYSSFRNSDPELQARLDNWVKSKPHSYAARMARANYLEHLGWMSRGTKLASETKDNQLQSMEAEFDRAIADLNAAIKLNPRLTVAYANIISLSKTVTSLEQRTVLLNKALEINPASYAVRDAYLLGLQPKWGGSIEAIRAFMEGMKSQVKNNRDLALLFGYDFYTVGSQMIEDGKYRDAIRYLDEAIKTSNNQIYYHDRGRTYLYLGEYDNALTDLDHALELGQPLSGTLSTRAWVNIYRNDPQQALTDADKAISLDGLGPSSRRARGLALEDLGRYPEALKEFTTALKYGQYEAKSWYLRGHLYLTHFKDYKKAEQDLKKAVDLAPRDTYYLFEYGQAVAYRNSCEAVPVFRTYLEVCNVKRTGCNDSSIERARSAIQRPHADACNRSGT